MPAPGPAPARSASRLPAAALLAAGLCAPAAGAGFFVTADGYFITAHPAAAEAAPVLIRDARGEIHPAALVVLHHGSGLALLKAEGMFDALPIADSGAPAPGDPVFAPRLPGREGAVGDAAPAQGRVTAAQGASGFRFVLEEGAAEPGAPLLDSGGNAVGVASGQEGEAIGSGPLLALMAAEQPALAQRLLPGAQRPGAGGALGRVQEGSPQPAPGAEPDRGEILAQEMFRLGERARLRGDYPAARAWLGGAAGLGLAGAQRALGEMHEAGEGGAADGAEAARWYRQAAAQGDAQAQARLGWLHAEGRGLPRDEDAALAWFRRAAEAGEATGQDALGVMYRDGRGVYRDEARAAHWFRLAALQGDAAAQERLAALFREGRGVERDEAEAAWWLRRAAEQGRAEAQYRLGLLYREGRGVPRDEAEAGHWLRRAAARGHGPAAQALEAAAATERPRQDAPRMSGTLR